MPAITKSRAKLTAWEWTRELDRLALPLIMEFGVDRAHWLAQHSLELEGRRPCGGRLEETGGNLGSTEQGLAGGRLESSTGRAKC